jgi:hypothetical protein
VRTVTERRAAAREAVADEERGGRQRGDAPQRHHRRAAAQPVHRLLEQEGHVHVGNLREREAGTKQGSRQRGA